VYHITADGEERLDRIKGAMIPYLDALGRAVDELRTALYR